ncbi:hypothetical protein ABH924_003328 [Arthrobacter sp. GAS37]
MLYVSVVSRPGASNHIPLHRAFGVGCDIEAESGQVNASGAPGRLRTVYGMVRGV